MNKKITIAIFGILLLASVVFAGVILNGDRTTTKDTTHIKSAFGNDVELNQSKITKSDTVTVCLVMLDGFTKECSEFPKGKLSESQINLKVIEEHDKLIEKANNELGNISSEAEEGVVIENIKVNH